MSISYVVLASYVLDWIIIIIAAGVGAVLNIISPFKRPFSLYDQDISFPFVQNEKISTSTLVIVSFAVPLVVIAVVCLLLVPGPTISGKAPKRVVWQRKLWELFTGWTGLALSCAAAFIITQGMKNLFGRPRPHLLSLCDADYANAIKFAVGALAPGNVTLRVSNTICRNTDKSNMDDAFRSFPSGHSSFSAAGLVYLSLFLASKLSITIPLTTPQTRAKTSRDMQSPPSSANAYDGNNGNSNMRARNTNMGSAARESVNYAQPSGHDDVQIAARDQAASPPIYLLVFAAAPIFAAIYIASTRFTDFKHHAFDILFGQFIGISMAWFAFRWYHLPIRNGAGWSWGPRSRDRAFWAGVGIGTYTLKEEEKMQNRRGKKSYGGNDDEDLEAGRRLNGDSSQVGDDVTDVNDPDIELKPLKPVHKYY